MTRPTVPHAFQSPRWFQTVNYIRDPISYLETGYDRCGDIFRAPVIGSQDQVFMVSDPDALKTIFTNDTKHLFAPPNQLLLPIVGARSIFALEHERHRRARKLLMPPFHRDHIPQYGALIIKLTQKALASLSPDQPFLARGLMQEITLDVILTVVFGLGESPRFGPMKALIVQLTDMFLKPGVAFALFQPWLQKNWAWSPWGQFLRIKDQLSALIYDELRDRQGRNMADQSVDILSLLIQSRDENGLGMSDQELHDQLLTLLLAGYETTATAMSWAFYWVHRDRRVFQTLMAELDHASFDPMEIVQLPYLSAVCHESLRIYPVAMLTMPREVREPVSLLGFDLSPGTHLYGAIYLIHRRPDLYPEPEKFRPERFLERQYNSFEFLPFGGGVRRCIGDILAQFEMKLALAVMLRERRFRLLDTEPEVPKRRGVTLAPARGVSMALESF